MWWILGLVGAAALFVLVLAGAYLAFRGGGKRKAESFDDDFSSPPPPAEPERMAPSVEEEAPEPAPPVAPPEPVAPPPVEPVAPPPEPVAPPVEPVAPAPVAPESAPAAAEPVAEEPAEEPPPVFDMLQKARIAGVDLVLRAYAVRFGDEELLGFGTEGFAAHNKPDVILYMAMPEGDPGDVIKAGLKFFSFVSLKLHERPEPILANDVLAFPGHIGPIAFGGFLAVAANEPEEVPMDPHLVLLAVPRTRMSTDPGVLRATLSVNGVLPYRSEPEPA